jgi:putative transcriptional regulator
VALLVWRLARDARRGDPFTADTVRRLRRLAWLVLFGGVAVGVASGFAASALARSLVDGGETTHGQAAIWMWIGVGAAIGAVAEDRPPWSVAARRVRRGDLMPPEEEHRVEVHIDKLLAERGLTLTELADRVGLTLANLSVLKNGRARAVRFSTLSALCTVLQCQPGDLFTVAPERRARR